MLFNHMYGGNSDYAGEWVQELLKYNQERPLNIISFDLIYLYIIFCSAPHYIYPQKSSCTWPGHHQ